ncbi:hypothetical protein M409DRAFT_67080 [Zasmidium cellare ATCC 36951]|uniref:Anoctamin dimerisation domain-containing protein n=1 Tax=Zasmidium cellare ATCC 36951 TaxID=1080233 RepID=A0A6A6CGE0_ZASCE|nr:uncharacterized protein M409DRAFT_67080 [Zasmidium cellare ATCC 36951]KAF2165713.1 hypothetical protein M409DRAFT_67080 [Zasmidium cellare ATCC 36951]
MAKSQALHTNMGVDYVIVFRFKPSEKAKATASFEKLCHKLSSVGLATEVRNGEDSSVLVFVKVASDEHMHAEIYRSRVKDWIHGVRSSEPPRDIRASLEQDPLTDAERLRIIYQLITNYEEEGGAGIRPKSREWEFVENVFALHDHTFNKHWIKEWATKYRVTIDDLDDIRNRFGEKVAYYFAFENTYFTFLIPPTVVGILAYFILGSFSPFYAALQCLWSVVFVEWWKHQERDLALRWGVRGVSNIESKRHEFHATKQVEDPATGETQKVFPWSERLQRQLLQIPFAFIAALVLGSLICLCFAIEIFIGEVYSGPGKSVLTFTPTVILTTCLPLLTGAMSNLAKRLNDYENYETDSQYDRQHTGKLFVLDFITSYMGIMLTAFVYVPFGSVLVPSLDVFGKVLAKDESQLNTAAKKGFTINPDRLRKQVIYFAVTASIVNFAMEVVVPYFKRQGLIKFKEMTAKGTNSGLQPSANAEDPPDEKEFLDRVRSEAGLPAYDVYTDLREMIIQFGYLSLFGVVWPLVPASYLVNNWFELRADAVKICIEMQRPTPWRADTIGPWLDALSFLTWFGSITVAALTYMFSNDGIGPDGRPHDIKAWGLLLSIFFSEHLYLFVHHIVADAISRIDSPGRQKERRDRYLTRQKLFQNSLEKLPQTVQTDDSNSAPITRATLEEDARQGSLKSSTPIEQFWSRQKGWRESAKMGQLYIEKAIDEKEAAKGKKEL